MWSLLIKCRDPWQPKVNAGLWTWLVLSRWKGGSKFFINISHSARKLKSLVGDGKGKWDGACTLPGVNIIFNSHPRQFKLTVIVQPNLLVKAKNWKSWILTQAHPPVHFNVYIYCSITPSQKFTPWLDWKRQWGKGREARSAGAAEQSSAW